LLTDLTVGSELPDAVIEDFERTPPDGGHAQMVVRGRHTAEIGHAAKSMFQLLGPEHMWPDDFPAPLRKRLLDPVLRSGRHRSRASEVKDLYDLDYNGPSLVDSDMVNVDTQTVQSEHAVTVASEFLAERLHGTAAGARLNNNYFFDSALGKHTSKAEEHLRRHSEAVLERERRTQKMGAVRGPHIKFDAQSDRICAKIQSLWTDSGGNPVVARVHATPTAENFRTKRPVSVRDLKERFHHVYHAAQHDLMVANADELCLVVMEGPAPKRRDAQVS